LIIDFKKRHGVVVTDGQLTDYNALKVSCLSEKNTVLLQAVIILNGTQYLSSSFSIPKEKAILSQLIAELQSIHG